MGFEALLGGCEHCPSEYRGQGNDLKVFVDSNVSKDTTAVGLFTEGTDNSIGGLHKELGFPHFQYVTTICDPCLRKYKETDELFNQFNVDKILILFYAKGEIQKHQVISRPTGN